MIELGILLVVGVVTFMIFARGEGAEGQSEMTVSDVDGAFKEKGWD